MTQAAQLAQYGASSVGLAFKNRIINGAMMIDQRNAGASVNVSGVSYVYQIDRFYCGGLNGVATPFTLQQVTDAPANFTQSVKITVTNTDALSNAATEYGFQTNFEANNTFDFNLGKSTAQTVTLSFWVKSSLTGTFGIGFRNAPTFNRTYVATYTINSANTWEYKTISLALDTTGTWNNSGTSQSLNITWSLGCGANFRTTAGSWGAGGQVQTSGSVNLVSNAAATWFITGVQLEVGSTATSFDYRPYGTELQLCQRYLPAFTFAASEKFITGHAISTTQVVASLPFPATARAAATGITASAGSNFALSDASLNYGANQTGTAIAFESGGVNSGSVRFTCTSGLVAGNASTILSRFASTQILFTGCEL